MKTLRQSDKCFCQYQFWCKNVNFVQKKKNWNFGRNVDFFIKCALLLKVIIFLQDIPIFRKMWQIFYAKCVRFWANEWISKYSDKIMSSKLWGKVTMFLSISILVQKCQFCAKKIEILGEMLQKHCLKVCTTLFYYCT